MSAPIEEKKVEDTKPLEVPTQTAETLSLAPVAEDPVATTTEEKKTEDTTPQELPAASTTTPVAAAAAAAAAPATSTEEKPVEEQTTDAAAVTQEEKPVEAVTSGVLGYKAPGLVHQFKFSKRYFWLGDEAVSTQSLSHYLRGTEAKIAHPVAAWSSQTGKGLLYLVKTEADKAHPQDVISLADATDLKMDSPQEISFKVHGEKHAFKAATDAERNGWYKAIEAAITEAKASKETILTSDGYQESIKTLGKPAVLAGGSAAGLPAVGSAAAAKKSEDKPAETEAATEPTEAPARKSSVSSASSSDAEKAAKKAEKKNKRQSRSASRSKRSSIFGSLLGKKEEQEAKKEVKEEQKEEAKAVDAPAAAATAETGAVVAGTGAAVAGATAAVIPTDNATDVPATAPEVSTATTTETKPEEKKEETATPKAAKRSSIFGSIYQKVRSPASEKKESDVAPVVPAKDETKTEAVAPLTPAEPATETATETPAAPTVEEPVETKPVETPAAPIAEKKTEKADTPKKEKDSFFGLGGFLSKARAKSPAAGKRDVKEAEKASAVAAPAVPAKDDKIEEPKPVEAAPIVEAPSEAPVPAFVPAETAVTDAVDAPTVPKTEETPAATDATATTESPAATTTPTTKESRRRSLFAGFGANKKDAETSEGVKSSEKRNSLFRKGSDAIRSATQKKESKKENVTPAAEKATTSEDKPVDATPATIAKPAETAEPAKPTSIGDVTADSVSVGQPQESRAPVSASA